MHGGFKLQFTQTLRTIVGIGMPANLMGYVRYMYAQ